MFGWDFHNSKSDRMKLFLFLLVVFLIVALTVSSFFRFLNKDSAEAAGKIPRNKINNQPPSSFSSPNDSASKAATNGTDPYDQTETFSVAELNETKKTAVQFVKAFHTYNADKPQAYLENAQPFMTDALYQKMKRNGRREVLERSYLSVKETDVTPVVNQSQTIIRWNVIVKGEAKSVDGKTSSTEDWYLVGLCKVGDQWKVEDVTVNAPS